MFKEDNRYPIERVYPREFKAVIDTLCITRHEFHHPKLSQINNDQKQQVRLAKILITDLLSARKVPVTTLQLFLGLKTYAETRRYQERVNVVKKTPTYQRLKRHVKTLISNGR